MPQYINRTSTSKYVDGINLEPNIPVITEKYIQNINFNCDVDLTVNTYDPVIYSAPISSLTTVTLPAGITGSYCVSIFSDIGVAQVVFNTASNKTLYLPAGTLHEQKCMARVINSVTVTPGSGGTVYVTITKN